MVMKPDVSVNPIKGYLSGFGELGFGQYLDDRQIRVCCATS